MHAPHNLLKDYCIKTPTSFKLIPTMAESFSVIQALVMKREPIQDLNAPLATSQRQQQCQVRMKGCSKKPMRDTGANEEQLPPPPSEEDEQSLFFLGARYPSLPHRCGHAGAGWSTRAAGQTPGGANMRATQCTKYRHRGLPDLVEWLTRRVQAGLSGSEKSLWVSAPGSGTFSDRLYVKRQCSTKGSDKCSAMRHFHSKPVSTGDISSNAIH